MSQFKGNYFCIKQAYREHYSIAIASMEARANNVRYGGTSVHIPVIRSQEAGPVQRGLVSPCTLLYAVRSIVKVGTSGLIFTLYSGLKAF